MVEQAFGHHRVAAGIELYGPDYIITVEIRDFDDYGMYKALGYENADYGNRNAHYNEIVEAARNWFDEEIFERYPTWEAVEKTSVQNCTLENMPSYETLLKAFGGNEKNVASHWSLCVKQGVGAEVLTRFTPLKESQIRHALANINPSPRRLRRLEWEAQEAERPSGGRTGDLRP